MKPAWIDAAHINQICNDGLATARIRIEDFTRRTWLRGCGNALGPALGGDAQSPARPSSWAYDTRHNAPRPVPERPLASPMRGYGSRRASLHRGESPRPRPSGGPVPTDCVRQSEAVGPSPHSERSWWEVWGILGAHGAEMATRVRHDFLDPKWEAARLPTCPPRCAAAMVETELRGGVPRRTFALPGGCLRHRGRTSPRCRRFPCTAPGSGTVWPRWPQGPWLRPSPRSTGERSEDLRRA